MKLFNMILEDANMTEPKKIGMLTPSANTTLETVCSRMLHDVPEVTCHYARFPVIKSSLEQDSIEQFKHDKMLRAAELLAHAEVDVIAWNGTSGGWLGADKDRELCDLIAKTTGIPATTSMLAMLDAFSKNNVKTCHLVTPYIPEMNEAIKKQYQKYGIETINSEGCDITMTRAMGQVSNERIESMIKNVTSSPADGISIMCTNFPAINNVEYFEKKYNQTIYDAIAVVVWKGMEIVGVDPSKVKGWGKLFQA
jgi:maleate isomerase